MRGPQRRRGRPAHRRSTRGRRIGQAYNVADDDQFTYRQWAERVIDLLGAEMELVSIPSELAPSALAELPPPGARPHLLVDNNKAKRELGYQQVVAAEDALAEAVRWLVDNPVTAEQYPMYAGKFDYDMEDRLYRRVPRRVRLGTRRR